MDEMKIALSTKFMRGLMAKLIRKVVSEKFGVRPDIQLNEISVTHKDGKVRLHLSVDGEMTSEDLDRLLRTAGLL